MLICNIIIAKSSDVEIFKTTIKVFTWPVGPVNREVYAKLDIHVTNYSKLIWAIQDHILN